MQIKALFIDGNEPAEKDADVELWSDRVHISTADKKYDWHYDKLEITQRPTRRRKGKFLNPDFPGTELLVEKAGFKQIAKKTPVKINTKHRRPLTIMLSIASILFALLYIVPELSPALINYFPGVEDRLGSIVTESYKKEHKLCSNEKGKAALDKLTSVMTSGLGKKFHAIVIDDKGLLLKVAPAGNIIIYGDLLENVESENKLDGILAYELGHAEGHDGWDYIIRAVMTRSILSLGGKVTLGEDDVATEYSRTEEIFAEKFALRLLQRKRISPQGLHDYAKEEMYSHGDNFFASYPERDRRLAEIKKHIDPAGKYYTILTPEEWKDLKGICQ